MQTYNQVVSSVHERTSPFVKNLRANLINNAIFEDKPWVTKTLHDIRDAAVNKVLNGIANNRAKKDNKFTIHFKKMIAK